MASALLGGSLGRVSAPTSPPKKTGGGVDPGATPSKKRKFEGKCYKCGQEGHRRFECTK